MLAVVFAAVSLLKVAVVPLVDPDAPWHVLLGSRMWSGVSPALAGRGWTFAPVDDSHWVSTQWLAELLLAAAHAAGGWNGLLVLRAALALVLLVLLAGTLLPGRPARAAVPVFILVASPILLGSIQERPQSLSYLLLVPLSWWALGIVRDARLPPLWLVLPLAVVWANTHGLWILLPAVFALAALSRWLDQGLRDRIALRSLVLALAALACGLVSPAGMGTLTAAWRFREAATQITEWQPVNLISPDATPLLIITAITVAAWARGSGRPPRSELLFVGGVLVFALTAYRNIPSALLLTAPLVVERVNAAWTPRRSVTSPRERQWLTMVATSVVGVSAILALVIAATDSPFPGSAPVSLAEPLAGQPEAARLLPEYDESGLVLNLTQPRSRTAIDGRADLFGAPYITKYLTMINAGYGWESTVRDLDPTSAILKRTTNLAKELQRCGWRIEASTPTHLLLVPTPGWTCPAGD